jgi:hypothetical protein
MDDMLEIGLCQNYIKILDIVENIRELYTKPIKGILGVLICTDFILPAWLR